MPAKYREALAEHALHANGHVFTSSPGASRFLDNLSR